MRTKLFVPSLKICIWNSHLSIFQKNVLESDCVVKRHFFKLKLMRRDINKARNSLIPWIWEQVLEVSILQSIYMYKASHLQNHSQNQNLLNYLTRYRRSIIFFNYQILDFWCPIVSQYTWREKGKYNLDV